MAERKLNREEATSLAERTKAGEFNDNPQAKQIVLKALNEFRLRQRPAVDNAVLTDDEPGFLDDVKRRTSGAAQVAGTVASSAVAAPVAGLRSLAGFVFGEDFNQRADAVRAWEDALTFDPRTDTGEEMLQSLAAPLQKIDDGADAVATFASGGNEFAATMIYTGLLGGLDIAGIKGGRTLRLGKLQKRQAELEKTAADLGVDLEPHKLAASVVEAAKDMTPVIRAQHADELRSALTKARDRQNTLLKASLGRARDTKAFVHVSKSENFANGILQDLKRQGFDLGEMPQVHKNIRALRELRLRDPASLGKRANKAKVIELENFQTVQNRIDKILTSRRDKPNLAKTTRENLALQQVSTHIDDFLDRQMHSDLIKGTPGALRNWKDFHAQRKVFNENFAADRSIVQLMDMNASPLEINRWLLGASAVAAKPHATRTVLRLKEILGKDHPSIEGIRQDFLYNIAAPLMDEKPNFRAFVRNVDRVQRDQSHLLSALDLDISAMQSLRNFANAADKIRAPSFPVDVARSLSQFFFGHDIARKGLIVRSMTFPIRAMGRVLFGRGPQSGKRKLIAELANANHSTPAMNPLSAAAGRAISTVFWADVAANQRNKDDNKQAVGQN